MKKSTIVEIICSLIAVLFAYAAVSKLLEFNEFKLQLSKSPFITNFYSLLVWLLPSVELATALLLAFSKLRLIGLYVSLFLLSLFTTYLVAMLNLSYYVPCSCGGVLSMLSWKEHIIFNLFFWALSTAGIMINNDNERKTVTSLNQKNIELKLSADTGVAENL